MPRTPSPRLLKIVQTGHDRIAAISAAMSKSFVVSTFALSVSISPTLARARFLNVIQIISPGYKLIFFHRVPTKGLNGASYRGRAVYRDKD